MMVMAPYLNRSPFGLGGGGWVAAVVGVVVAVAAGSAAGATVTPEPKVNGPLVGSLYDNFGGILSQPLGATSGTPVFVGLSADAAVSPDGLRLAYIAPVRSLSQVFVVPLQGADPPVQLTHDAAGAFQPTWSSDGNALAFTSIRDGNQEIYTIDRGTGAERRLTSSPGADRQPAWAPTGDLIAFQSDRAGRPAIWAMGPDGAAPHPLTDGSRTDAAPHWSPDGQALAYSTALPNSGHAIAKIGRAGGAPRLLTPGTANDTFPVWAPDGSRIAFTSDRGSGHSTWSIAPTGETRAAPATDIGNGIVDAAWAPLPTPPAAAVQLPSTAAAATTVADAGRVTVKAPEATVAAPLVADARIPLGSTVDATGGRVELTVKATAAAPSEAVVSGGVFTVAPDPRQLTIDLRQTDGERCPAPGSRHLASMGKFGDPYHRHVSVHSRGRVSTVANHHSFSSKGTKWRVTATCRGTTVRVFEGVVVDRSIVTGRSVEVHAGHMRFTPRAGS